MLIAAGALLFFVWPRRAPWVICDHSPMSLAAGQMWAWLRPLLRAREWIERSRRSLGESRARAVPAVIAALSCSRAGGAGGRHQTLQHGQSPAAAGDLQGSSREHVVGLSVQERQAERLEVKLTTLCLHTRARTRLHTCPHTYPPPCSVRRPCRLRC